MRLLADLFPIIVFFIVYKTSDIFAATVAAIAISCAQVLYTWLRYKRFEKMQLITMLALIILGGATLAFHNEMFIKWKPSVVNWAFALAFMLSQFIGSKPLVQRLMGRSLQLPSFIWSRLNSAWALFFVIIGVLNLLVAYNFSTDAWVNFKLFGNLGLTFAFAIAQSIYLARIMSKLPQDKQ